MLAHLSKPGRCNNDRWCFCLWKAFKWQSTWKSFKHTKMKAEVLCCVWKTENIHNVICQETNHLRWRYAKKIHKKKIHNSIAARKIINISPFTPRHLLRLEQIALTILLIFPYNFYGTYNTNGYILEKKTPQMLQGQPKNHSSSLGIWIFVLVF